LRVYLGVYSRWGGKTASVSFTDGSQMPVEGTLPLARES
jgi:hypothetical protein